MKMSLILKLFGAVVFAVCVAGLAYGFGFIAIDPQLLTQNVFVVDMKTLSQPVTLTPVSGAGGGAPAAAAAPALPPIAELLAKADPAAGEKFAKVCTTCHSFGKGEPAKMGPNLYGIIGSKHAHMVGYSYSDAMKSLSDKVWTMEELNIYLYNPRARVPGTKMPYAGIKSDSDRGNVIAWLRTVSDHPEPIPTK